MNKKVKILCSANHVDLPAIPEKTINGNEYPEIVDQMSANDYNINEYGFIRNDITALERAGTSQEVELIMSRLREMRSDPVNADISDDEILRRVIPRYAQDPTEYAAYLDYINSLDRELIDNEMRRQTSAATDTEPTGNVEPSTVNE